MKINDDIISAIIKNTKWVILFIIISIIIVIAINLTFKAKNIKNIGEYLLDNGYKEQEKNIFTKNEFNNDGKKAISINYIYSVNANKFTKNIDIRSELKTNYFSLLYNGTDNIQINFEAESYENENRTSISQSATYDLKNNKFKNCEIDYVKNNHPSHCDAMKKYGTEFSKEIKEILKNAKVNRFFETEDSDEW